MGIEEHRFVMETGVYLRVSSWVRPAYVTDVPVDSNLFR